jgi:ABC-type branched-subunit amino acid transport system substrate-binding protein
MTRLRSLPAVAVVAIIVACTTTTAARGTGEPSTRVVNDGGVERRAEDVALEMLTQGQSDVGRDDASAKTSFRRVVDEFADTTSRGPATVALSRLLLAESTPASSAEAQRWLEKFLYEEPAHSAAEDARSLLAMSQLGQGDASKAAPALAALVEKLPEDERGPALVRLGRELVSAGKAKDGVAALLAALPRLSGADRSAVERDVIFALDVAIADGGVPFEAVPRLRQEFGSDAFADEVTLWKLARINAHLRDDQAASSLASELIRKHPRSRFAADAKSLVEKLAERVQVNPNVVGVVLPLSGEYAAYGKRAMVAIRLAFNLPVGRDSEESDTEVDAETGEVVLKKKREQILVGTMTTASGLKLIIKDSAGRADVAAAAVKELVERDHVIAIIGDILVDTSLPMALAAEDYGVPLISLSRRDGVPEAGPWTFRLALTPKKQAEALAAYAVDGMKYQRFAIMYPKHAFGIELMGYFWDALDARQAEVTAIESYAHDQTTFTTEAKSLVGRGMVAGTTKEVTECRAEAREIKNDYRRRKVLEGCNDKAKPIIDFQAVFIPDSYRAVSFVIPALISEDVLLTNHRFAVEAYKKATGNDKVRPVQLLGANTMNDPDIATRMGRQVDGAVFVDGVDFNNQTPLVQNFVEGFGRGARSRPTLIEAQVYDAARLIGSVLEGQNPATPGTPGAKPKTRAAVKDAIANVKNFAGVTGPISFDAQGDSVVPLNFFKIEREKVENVPVAELVKGAG